MGMSINANINNNITKYQNQLATGKRVNSAADNASAMAIIEKLNAQEKGLAKGNENTATMQDLLKTAEGGLSGISDALQRVRELSLQAANGTMEQSDKEIVQNEISQIMQGINGMAKTTEFNNQKLLDGSFTNKNTASNADGSGKNVSIAAMDISSLDLEDYDVTGSFNLESIDNAIASVNAARSQIGATSNAFDSTMNSNSITELNLAASKSRMADTDMGKASMEYNKNKLLLDYQTAMQKLQQEDEQKKLTLLK